MPLAIIGASRHLMQIGARRSTSSYPRQFAAVLMLPLLLLHLLLPGPRSICPQLRLGRLLGLHEAEAGLFLPHRRLPHHLRKHVRLRILLLLLPRNRCKFIIAQGAQVERCGGISGKFWGRRLHAVRVLERGFLVDEWLRRLHGD